LFRSVIKAAQPAHVVNAGELRLRTHSVVAEDTGTDWSWEDKLVSGVRARACVMRCKKNWPER